MEYSYRVFLLPKIGNHAKSSDLAIEFINVASLDEKSMEQYESIVTLLKTHESTVAHPGLLKPSDVMRKVALKLGSRFTVNDHTKCWKHFGVRPSVGSDDATKCKTKYCHFDVPHRDYIY